MEQIHPHMQKVFDWQAAWNKRDLGAADDLFADDFVFNGRDRDWSLPELKQWYLDLVAGYPAAQASIDSLLMEDNAIAIRWSIREHGELISQGGGIGSFENGKLAVLDGMTSEIAPAAAKAAQGETLRKQVLMWSEAWNSRDLAAADAFFAADFVYQGSNRSWSLPELKQWYLEQVEQHPEIRNQIDDLVVEGNAVGINWSLFAGDETISIGGGIGTFKDGKLASFTGLTSD
jgi:ketosteroid isomerase-like protein